MVASGGGSLVAVQPPCAHGPRLREYERRLMPGSSATDMRSCTHAPLRVRAAGCGGLVAVPTAEPMSSCTSIMLCKPGGPSTGVLARGSETEPGEYRARGPRGGDRAHSPPGPWERSSAGRVRPFNVLNSQNPRGWRDRTLPHPLASICTASPSARACAFYHPPEWLLGGGLVGSLP